MSNLNLGLSDGGGGPLCETCGTPLAGGANYCHFCGKGLRHGSQPPPRPRVRTGTIVAGLVELLLNGLKLSLAALLIGGIIGGSWWVIRTFAPSGAKAREEQLQEEVYVADQRVSRMQGQVADMERAVEEETRKRKSAEQSVDGLNARITERETQIAELERLLRIEVRMRNGLDNYVDDGTFSDAAATGKDANLEITDDPGAPGNPVLSLDAAEPFITDLWVPGGKGALLVRFRAFVTAEAGGETGTETDPAAPEDETGKTGTIHAALLGPGESVAAAQTLALQPSAQWLEIELLFGNLESPPRELSLAATDFPGKILIDDLDVVDPFPIELSPEVYKYYDTPAEKVYYHFLTRLQATHRENVAVELPEIKSTEVTLRYNLMGERVYYRFKTTKVDSGAAEVTAGPLGETNKRHYRLEKSAENTWSITDITVPGPG